MLVWMNLILQRCSTAWLLTSYSNFEDDKAQEPIPRALSGFTDLWGGPWHESSQCSTVVQAGSGTGYREGDAGRSQCQRPNESCRHIPRCSGCGYAGDQEGKEISPENHSLCHNLCILLRKWASVLGSRISTTSLFPQKVTPLQP